MILPTYLDPRAPPFPFDNGLIPWIFNSHPHLWSVIVFLFKLRKRLYLQILHSERSFVISFFPLLFCLVYYFYRYKDLSSFNFIHPPNNIYYFCTWVSNPSILYRAVCGVGQEPTMIPHHHIFIKIIKCGVLFNTCAVLSISDWHDKAKLGELLSSIFYMCGSSTTIICNYAIVRHVVWWASVGVCGGYKDSFIMAIVKTRMLKANTLDPTRLIWCF